MVLRVLPLTCPAVSTRPPAQASVPLLEDEATCELEDDSAEEEDEGRDEEGHGADEEEGREDEEEGPYDEEDGRELDEYEVDCASDVAETGLDEGRTALDDEPTVDVDDSITMDVEESTERAEEDETLEGSSLDVVLVEELMEVEDCSVPEEFSPPEDEVEVAAELGAGPEDDEGPGMESPLQTYTMSLVSSADSVPLPSVSGPERMPSPPRAQ